MAQPAPDWRTKPTDRFILRWMKLHLAARVTPRLCVLPWLAPWMVTAGSTALGVGSGAAFAFGWGFFGGALALLSQVADGVDGQLARLSGRVTRRGAFLDSVLDRYADGAMVAGLAVFVSGGPLGWPAWVAGVLGVFALIGCAAVSYTTARAETLSLSLGPPTLAGKGTRVAAIIVAGLASPLFPWLPGAALVFLALAPNVVVFSRLLRAKEAPPP